MEIIKKAAILLALIWALTNIFSEAKADVMCRVKAVYGRDVLAFCGEFERKVASEITVNEYVKAQVGDIFFVRSVPDMRRLSNQRSIEVYYSRAGTFTTAPTEVYYVGSFVPPDSALWDFHERYKQKLINAIAAAEEEKAERLEAQREKRLKANHTRIKKLEAQIMKLEAQRADIWHQYLAAGPTDKSRLEKIYTPINKELVKAKRQLKDLQK